MHMYTDSYYYADLCAVHLTPSPAHTRTSLHVYVFDSKVDSADGAVMTSRGVLASSPSQKIKLMASSSVRRTFASRTAASLTEFISACQSVMPSLPPPLQMQQLARPCGFSSSSWRLQLPLVSAGSTCDHVIAVCVVEIKIAVDQPSAVG